ncbi:FAD-dependent oxidoreductase [Pseudotenacibaculum sp. MALMAid0570]|uniref:NAD(P)/FAD-dependent oxidoreductase n=1 Tax=Pseudotenacibaculum sp. MALMAid0570 TaxID=3143938 RepID=UPI0032DF045A
MEVDYIIVGLGLAGLAFAEELSQNNKSFVVFEDHSQTSSLVAGGVYNPVILKRFTPVWNAKEQLEIALPFYHSLEKKLGSNLDYKFSTRKVFKSIEDQNNWYIASDKPILSEFMNPKILKEKVNGIIGDYGFGEVYKTGRIDTHKLIEFYRKRLEEKDQIKYEKFNHSEIAFTDSSSTYKGIVAKQIVFCEGFGLKQNPFFNYLPLNEAKGELITIHAPNLNIQFLVKSTLFILPIGDDLYKVGATFNWKDKTSTPTDEGKQELIDKLKKVIDVPYQIVDHSAGIRPTVKDRRPLVGVHPKYKQLVVFNGLGTRGVMIAPSLAKELYKHLENGEEISKEISISRYKKTLLQ